MRAVLCINFELSRSFRTQIEIYNSVLEIRLARRSQFGWLLGIGVLSMGPPLHH